jgi:leucyl-tRNA synthetase
VVEAIEPIPIIETEGMGTLPAVDICEEMEIEDQYDRKKLQRAKEEVYKYGFYAGTMLDTIPKYGGMKVEEAKDSVKEDLLEAGEASIMYEPSGEVVCRCLTPSVVKVVTDQWFIAYGDASWKEKVHRALDGMNIYPPAVRKQFDYVIDWLQDWACTREFGLGTKLPWEDRWVIESLSDSTVYMAFYTVNKHLEHMGVISRDRIDPDFFAFCFEGKGDPAELAERYGCETSQLEEARAEFEYWYPFTVRGSGKDLVQNHLTFSLFNHTALFPEDRWPRGFAVNGWLRVEGQKMSKSLGNFIPLKNVLKDYGADVSRFTLALGGEGVDDPNWDSETARTTARRFQAWLDFIEANRGRGREPRLAIDDWFEAVLNDTLATVRDHFENWRFRSALKSGYYDLQSHLRWYVRRCGDAPNAELMDAAMRLQTQILSPVSPHLAEEAWEALGAEGMACTSRLPEPVEADERARRAMAGEQLLVSTMDDIREILRITGIEPSTVRLFTAPAWKRAVHDLAAGMQAEGKLDMSGLMKAAMADPEVRGNSKLVPPFAQQLVTDIPRTSPEVLERISALDDETAFLMENRDFIEREVGCTVQVASADDPELDDPANKARQAIPARVAIYVE